MSNIGKYVDSTPFIPGAGSVTAIAGENADQCMRQDLYFKPETQTPENLVKFRKTRREIPGIKQLHHGIYDDPKDYEKIVHGVPTLKSDHVPDCIVNNNLSGTKGFINDLKENIFYSSLKREPLGKGIKRNYRFPTEVNDSNFKFGIPTVGFVNAKELIYNSVLDEPPAVKEMYGKTHKLCDPGEQKNRKYNWHFNKFDHVFGLPQEKEVDGVKKCLLIDNSQCPYPKTVIGDKHLEDFLQSKAHIVGKPTYHGSLHSKIGPDHTFGVSTNLAGQWNAGKCIYGDPKEVNKNCMLPDPDLGRNVRYRAKLKNLRPIEFNSNRVFGLPSIREDLPKKRVRSCTDYTNYGDEDDAYELLYPHPCATMGVHDDDFDVLHTKEEIVKILKDNNFLVPDEEINSIYDIALKNYPNEEGKISYQSFISTLRNLKKEYNKYRSLVPE